MESSARRVTLPDVLVPGSRLVVPGARLVVIGYIPQAVDVVDVEHEGEDADEEEEEEEEEGEITEEIPPPLSQLMDNFGFLHRANDSDTIPLMCPRGHEIAGTFCRSSLTYDSLSRYQWCGTLSGVLPFISNIWQIFPPCNAMTINVELQHASISVFHTADGNRRICEFVRGLCKLDAGIYVDTCPVQVVMQCPTIFQPFGMDTTSLWRSFASLVPSPSVAGAVGEEEEEVGEDEERVASRLPFPLEQKLAKAMTARQHTVLWHLCEALQHIESGLTWPYPLQEPVWTLVAPEHERRGSSSLPDADDEDHVFGQSDSLILLYALHHHFRPVPYIIWNAFYIAEASSVIFRVMLHGGRLPITLQLMHSDGAIFAQLAPRACNDIIWNHGPVLLGIPVASAVVGQVEEEGDRESEPFIAPSAKQWITKSSPETLCSMSNWHTLLEQLTDYKVPLS